MQRRRDHVLRMQSQVLDLIGDTDDVAANLPRDIDHGSRATIARNQRSPIRSSFADSRNFSQPDWALRIVPDNCVPDILDALALRIRQDEVLLIIAVLTSDTGNVVGGA